MTPDRETEYSRLLRDYWKRNRALVNGAHVGSGEVPPCSVKMLVERQETLDKSFNELCMEHSFTESVRLEHASRLYAAAERHFGTPNGMVEAHRRQVKTAKSVTVH